MWIRNKEILSAVQTTAMENYLRPSWETAVTLARSCVCCMYTCVGKLGGRVTRMSEQRGTQGPGGDGHPSPAHVGQNKLGGPGEAK